VPLMLTGAAHAGRHSLTLPLTRTRADLRWPGGSLTHVGQPRKHGAQAVKQSQQGQDLRLGARLRTSTPSSAAAASHASPRAQRKRHSRSAPWRLEASAMPRYALRSARRCWSCMVA